MLRVCRRYCETEAFAEDVCGGRCSKLLQAHDWRAASARVVTLLISARHVADPEQAPNSVIMMPPPTAAAAVAVSVFASVLLPLLLPPPLLLLPLLLRMLLRMLLIPRRLSLLVLRMSAVRVSTAADTNLSQMSHSAVGRSPFSSQSDTAKPQE